MSEGWRIEKYDRRKKIEKELRNRMERDVVSFGFEILS